MAEEENPTQEDLCTFLPELHGAFSSSNSTHKLLDLRGRGSVPAAAIYRLRMCRL